MGAWRWTTRDGADVAAEEEEALLPPPLLPIAVGARSGEDDVVRSLSRGAAAEDSGRRVVVV